MCLPEPALSSSLWKVVQVSRTLQRKKKEGKTHLRLSRRDDIRQRRKPDRTRPQLFPEFGKDSRNGRIPAFVSPDSTQRTSLVSRRCHDDDTVTNLGFLHTRSGCTAARAADFHSKGGKSFRHVLTGRERSVPHPLAYLSYRELI